MPRGVAMYLFEVTRLTVLSCISTAVGDVAQDQRPQMRDAVAQKPSCSRMISAATFRIVCARCCSDRTSQFALAR